MGIVGVPRHFPNISDAISTETGMSTDRAVVLDDDLRALVDLLTLGDGAGIGCLSAIETDLGMGPIAERLVAGLPTPAQQIVLSGRQRVTFFPANRLVMLRHDRRFPHEWHATGNSVRSVSLDRDGRHLILHGCDFFLILHGCDFVQLIGILG